MKSLMLRDKNGTTVKLDLSDDTRFTDIEDALAFLLKAGVHQIKYTSPNLEVVTKNKMKRG